MAGLLYDPTKPMPLIEMVNNPAWMGVKPTLGQRNNNYGNLRTNDPFEGKTGVNKTYDTFETPEKGMRALARVLDTYSSKHGINTIDQLINRYAPASDNTGGSHENYKKFLAQRLGVDPNAPIDVKGRRADIMDAIIRFENKNRPLASREQLMQAIADADGTQENAQGTEPMNQFFGYHQDGAGEFASPASQAAVPPPALANMPPQNNQTLPPQDDDGYGAMRLLNFTEAEIAEAKRKGIPAEFYTAQAGLNNGVLAEPNAQVDPEADVPLRGPTGTGPVLAAPTVIQGDGSELEGAETGGILVTPANAGALDPNMPSGEGILTQTQLPPEPKMVQVSGQRRNQSPMSLQSVSPAVDFNDMLIRMGGRGVEASQRGGLAAFGAITDEYGKIQDANQSAALDAYESQLSASKKTSKQSADDEAQLGQIDAAIFDMNRAKSYLKEGGITGLFDNNIQGFFDKLSGNKRAVGRKLLEKLRVDDTLLRIAQTKGAISNKEMDLFLAPSPDLNDQEIVWEQWINDRIEAMGRIRTRLSGGEQVDPSEQASADQVNQFGSSVTTGSFNVGQSQTINGVEVKRTK